MISGINASMSNWGRGGAGAERAQKKIRRRKDGTEGGAGEEKERRKQR